MSSPLPPPKSFDSDIGSESGLDCGDGGGGSCVFLLLCVSASELVFGWVFPREFVLQVFVSVFSPLDVGLIDPPKFIFYR